MNSEQDIEISFAEQSSHTSDNLAASAEKYTKATLRGVSAGLGDLYEMVSHPIDNLVVPVLELTYDSLAFGYVAQSQSEYGFSPHQYSFLPDDICEKSAEDLFSESLNRMEGRKESITSIYDKFSEGDPETRTEMLAHGVVNLLGPGVIMKNAARVVYNVDKFGQFTRPATYKSNFPPSPPPRGLREVTIDAIRSTPGETTYSFIALDNGKLIFAPLEIPTSLFDKAGKPITIRVKHPDLNKFNSQGRKVIGGGEATFKDNVLTKVLPKTGHYTPDLEGLGSILEHVFYKNSFKSLNTYQDLTDISTKSAATNKVTQPTFTLFAPQETLALQPVSILNVMNKKANGPGMQSFDLSSEQFTFKPFVASQEIMGDSYTDFDSLLDDFNRHTSAWTAQTQPHSFFSNDQGIDFHDIVESGFRVDQYQSTNSESKAPQTEFTRTGEKPSLKKVVLDEVPEYVTNLFTDVNDVDPFLERFDDKSQARLEQEKSDLSEALLSEVRTIGEYQKYSALEIQKLNTAQERMEFARKAQDAAQAFSNMAQFAENHIHNDALSKGLNLASGISSMALAYSLGMSFAGVGAFVAGANILVSVFSKRSKGDNGISAGFQALDSKMNMILKLGLEMYEFMQEMDKRNSENFLNVFNGLIALHKSQRYITHQQQYNFGQLRAGIDFMIDSKQQDTLLEAARYGDSMAIADIKEDDFDRLMTELYLLTEEARASYLNGQTISDLERESGAAHALKDIRNLFSTGKVYGYFLSQLNDLGFTQEKRSFFNPLLTHAAVEKYMALGPILPKEVKNIINKYQEFMALTKILRLHIPRLQSKYFLEMYSVLEEMQTMYDYSKQTHDIVSNFAGLSARPGNAEFSVSDFPSKNIVLDGIGRRNNNNLERVRNSCVHNHEFYGLVYLGLATFTFSNYIVPRHKTNGKPFDNCPAVYIDFWDGAKYDLTDFYTNFNNNGHLWDWKGLPKHSGDAVHKSINKYNELRRHAVQQKYDDLKNKLPVWLNALRVASTKWYQSCLISDVHAAFCQSIPEFPFDKYSQEELLKSLEDDLKEGRRYTKALPMHTTFLTDLRDFRNRLQESEKNIAAQRSKYVFKLLHEFPADPSTIELEFGVEGCFIKLADENANLYYFHNDTKIVTTLPVLDDKQEEYEAFTREARFVTDRQDKYDLDNYRLDLFWPFVHLSQYDLKKFLSFSNQSKALNITLSDKTFDPVEYYLKQQSERLGVIYHELTVNPKPRVFAKSVNMTEIRRIIDVQQNLVDNGFRAVRRSMDTLSDLDKPGYQELLTERSRVFASLLEKRQAITDSTLTFGRNQSPQNSESKPKVTVLNHGSELQKLCSDPDVELAKIKTTLELLFEDSSKLLEEELNEVKSYELRPLYLAIKAQRDRAGASKFKFPTLFLYIYHIGRLFFFSVAQKTSKSLLFLLNSIRDVA
ncbi:MAG: hypothetical protein P1U74_07730, partial [Legionellaceae bacterium]|nr:hypothetical protein [Legionellaceae bacterium]